MASKKRRKKKRFRMQPRFFLILFVLVAAVLLIVWGIKKLTSDDADPNAVATPVPTATPAPTSTPKPSLPPNVAVIRDESAAAARLGFQTGIRIGGDDKSSYSRENAVSFGRDTEYAAVEGILTFGGSNYRNSFTYGIQSVSEKRMREAWSEPLGAISTWSGTGWTGQPLIVKWPDATLKIMNVAESFKTQEGGLTEVIYPAMDGKIYFLELSTGKQTRTPINAGVVQKGTACLDPRGYPLLYVGQGIPVQNDQGNNAASIRVYSLIDCAEIYKFGGYDWFSYRAWQAYDGSPIIANDTIVYGGENGVLYTAKLNTAFDAAAGTISVAPERLVKYRYNGSGYSRTDGQGRWYGIESSISAFRNFLFFTDNGGRLQCVDVNSMQLKYVVDVTDESDSSVVIEESFEDTTVYLYTGSQTRATASGLDDGFGYSYQRKINGLTGKVIWEKKQMCSIGDASNSGGLVATPHVGRSTSNIGNLVIYSLSLAVLPQEETAVQPQTGGVTTATTTAAPVSTAAPSGHTVGGRIIAYDKTTGDQLWALSQSNDYWASPVVIYDASGKGYLIQCDRGGIITMYDALTGTKLTTLDAGSRIDSTPAVFGDYLVVGTRGKGGSGKAAKIVGIKIS